MEKLNKDLSNNEAETMKAVLQAPVELRRVFWMAKEVKETFDVKEVSTLLGTQKWLVVLAPYGEETVKFILIRIAD